MRSIWQMSGCRLASQIELTFTLLVQTVLISTVIARNYKIDSDIDIIRDRTSNRLAGDAHRCECGVKGKQDVKIVGGVLSKRNSWPWVAAIVQVSESKGPKIVCGSSIISRNYLLTAGHCVEYLLYRGLHNFRIIMGTNDLNEEEALTMEILSATSHPKFDSTSLEYDVGLIELESSLDYSRSVFPICITPQVGVPFVEKNAVVAGWGSTVYGGNTTTMQMQTMVDVISNQECEEKYNDTTITNTMLCAQRNHKDSCQGDSGGPLFLLKEGKSDSYLQIGIVSFGKGCADSHYPGVYGRVSRFTSWVRSVIGTEDFCRA